MKTVIAPIKNVQNFAVAGKALIDRPVSKPGLGLVTGDVGLGKTRTLSWWANRVDAPYIRAFATWKTAGPMLASMCHELGIEPRRQHEETRKLVADTLARADKPRPLVVDEADYLVKYPELLDTLRDIHDLSGSAVLLIGMKSFVSKLLSLKEQEQFVSRVSQFVEFKPLDREDAGTLVNAIADVTISDALVDRMHAEAMGSARLLTIAVDQIENLAKRKGLKTVDADDAKNEKFTLDRRPDILDRLGIRRDPKNPSDPKDPKDSKK